MNYYKELLKPDPRAIFIAEAGINHDGDIMKAKKMIDAAAEANADYCKFQSFKAKKLVTPNALTSSYIDAGSNKGESFRDLLRRLELSEKDHYELKEYCDFKGIKFLSTPFDEGSFDFLLKLGIDMVKVASGNLTNIPLIKHMASAGLPMFVSTGMATLADIEEAIEAIVKEGNSQVLLFNCVSWYPAEIETTNLRFMQTLKSAFGFPVGYSDHTLGINMTIAARALGAVSLEKHFTLDSKGFGPDHSASIEPNEMIEMVKGIREVEVGLGVSTRIFSDKELNQRKVHRTSIVVSKPIKKGDVFTKENLTIKRPGIGLKPKYYEGIIGKVSNKDLDTEALLSWSDII
ncbi:MAG: N-acetylneuraminate synthase family protein [Saprospiraceae bacterium]|jgi:N,N'-diacetyllegionaminate synthase|nr:N-acetylneuraminate synthase family protein [Saprospiraceae bacterium]